MGTAATQRHCYRNGINILKMDKGKFVIPEKAN